MILHIIAGLILAQTASAQMSESPVGPNFKDPGRTTRYIPPPPVVSTPRPAPRAQTAPRVQAAPRVQPLARIQPPPPTSSEMAARRGPASVQTNREEMPPTPVRATPAPVAVRTSTTPVRRVASSTYSSEAYIPRVRTSTPYSERRSSAPSNWVISGFYNTANQTSYSGDTSVSGSSESYSATESSAPGLGVAGSYIYRPFNGFGYWGQLGLEYNRTATKLSGDAGGHAITSDYGAGYSTNTLTASGNASYSFGRPYIYGGVNYPYIMGSSAVHLTGLPGFQAGAGYTITRRWSIHSEYRVLRMKGTLDMPPSRLEVSEAQMRGFILAVDFSL